MNFKVCFTVLALCVLVGDAKRVEILTHEGDDHENHTYDGSELIIHASFGTDNGTESYGTHFHFDDDSTTETGNSTTDTNDTTTDDPVGVKRDAEHTWYAYL